MKNIFQKILTFGVVALLFAALCSVAVSAAPAVSIILSNKSPKAGDAVTVTVRISGVNHEGAGFDLQYNPDVLSYKGSESYASGGAGIVHVSDGYSSTSSRSFSLSFSARAAGSCDLKVASGKYVATGATTESSLPSAGYSLTVSDATKSDNANLRSLVPTSGTLSPRFSPSVTSYTVTVPKNIETCSFSATPEDEGAKVAPIDGNSKLQIGTNKFIITVTSAGGTQKQYTVVVTRTEKEEEIEKNPYEAQIGDIKYTLATDLTGINLPNGFTASSATYLDTEVAVAKDKNENFTLYFLKESGKEKAKFAPYLLEADEFVKLPCATYGNNTYIFSEFPENVIPATGFFKTTLTIGDNSVSAYQAETGDSDFYYLYCFFEEDFGVYRYDKKEGMLQRDPNFLLQETSPAPTDEHTDTPKSLTARISALSTGAKLILLLLLLAALVLIALIVFAFVSLRRYRNKNYDLAEGNLAFADQSTIFDDIQVEEDEE